MNPKPVIYALIFTIALAVKPAVIAADELAGAADFKKNIRPILEEYCYDCHGDGEASGGMALDKFNPDHDVAGSGVCEAGDHA